MSNLVSNLFMFTFLEQGYFVNITNLIVTHGKKYKFFSECLKGGLRELTWQGSNSQKYSCATNY